MIKIFVQVDQDPALHCSLHVLLHHHGGGPGQVQDHSPVTEETGHTIEMSLSEYSMFLLYLIREGVKNIQSLKLVPEGCKTLTPLIFFKGHVPPLNCQLQLRPP